MLFDDPHEERQITILMPYKLQNRHFGSQTARYRFQTTQDESLLFLLYIDYVTFEMF